MHKKTEVKIVQSPTSVLPIDFLERLPAEFEATGNTIYTGRNTIKTFQVGSRTVCVKKYSVPFCVNRVLYSWGWRLPKAMRTYENAQEILARGFQTPFQDGYVLVYEDGILTDSYSVGDYIANARTVGQDKTNPELVQAFARYTAQLHEKGLMHLDYILNNVLYTKGENGYEFTLIDINRFKFSNRPIRGFWQYVNLMHPFPQWGELNTFVRAYSSCTHAGSSLLYRVIFVRGCRNVYGSIKHALQKLPGAKYFSSKAKK